MAHGQIYVGISGWRYKGWRGVFYPKTLVQKKELAFASAQFRTIEINGSFYSLQTPASFKQWYDETPENFLFAVKGSRYVTHMRRLREIETPLANFFAQGVLRLQQKLGPILWQFPPSFPFDTQRFEEFFSLLPHSHCDAAKLGEQHDARVRKRAWLAVREDRKLRHAIEIRHRSFVCEEFIGLLRKYGIGLVIADTVQWPLLMDITADFVYCRLHGSQELYVSGYDDRAIDIWAHRAIRWQQGKEVEDGVKASKKNARKLSERDVFVYFDNDSKVRAPFDARKLELRVQRICHNESILPIRNAS